jgi:hypothetical protein
MSDPEKALRASAREPAIGDGYPAVSRFISSDLDGESYVFRKFRTLTARKLLYMQSQILELEEQLADFDRAAAASPDWELHLAARSWERLIANAESREKEKQIKKVIDEIETKLDNYRMFLPRAPLFRLLLIDHRHRSSTLASGSGRKTRNTAGPCAISVQRRATEF